MISINHLMKKMDNNVILDDITLNLDCGKYGLLGPNGAGKTTFMRCLLNIYKSPKGSILFGKESLKIGYLSQNFEAFSQMSVLDNMKYFCSVKGIKKRHWKDEINQSLKMVGMEENVSKLCRKLSGGMRRRVGIAQALLGHPDVIILDEPTAGLDPEERNRFVSMIRSLPDEMVVLFSTHIIEDVELCCDKVIVMNNGKICYDGSCKKLIDEAQNCIEKEKYKGNYQRAVLADGYMCVMKGLVKNEA